MTGVERVFRNMKHHIEQYYPSFTIRQLDNGIALIRNEKIISITSTPLEAHQVLLAVLGERKMPTLTPVVQETRRSTGTRQRVNKLGLPSEIEALPVINSGFAAEKTVVRLPLELFQALQLIASKRKRSLSTTALELIKEYLPLSKVRERVGSNADQKIGGKQKTLTILLNSDAQALLSRIPERQVTATLRVVIQEHMMREGGSSND